MGLYLNTVLISKATYQGLADPIVLALMQFEIRKFRLVPVGDEICSHWKRGQGRDFEQRNLVSFKQGG